MYSRHRREVLCLRGRDWSLGYFMTNQGAMPRKGTLGRSFYTFRKAGTGKARSLLDYLTAIWLYLLTYGAYARCCAALDARGGMMRSIVRSKETGIIALHFSSLTTPAIHLHCILGEQSLIPKAIASGTNMSPPFIQLDSKPSLGHLYHQIYRHRQPLSDVVLPRYWRS